MTQDKKGISAMKLYRHLDIYYNAAWRMRYKMMQVMMGSNRQFPLTGLVELDDATLGDKRSTGRRGRGVPAKTPIVAFIQTNEEGHALRVKLSVVDGFRTTEIAAWRTSTSEPARECSPMGWPDFMVSPRWAVLTRRSWSAEDG